MMLCVCNIVVYVCVLPVLCYCLVSGSATDSYPRGIWSEQFKDTRSALVGCSHPLPGPGVFAKLFLTDISNGPSSPLVFLDSTTTCTGSSTFGSCEYAEDRSVTVRVVITAMREGETRWYQCTAKYTAINDVEETQNTSVAYYGINTQANGAVSFSGTSPESPKSATTDALLPDSLVLVMLVMLIMMMTSASVLGVYYCRRRLRTQRSRDDDVMSMRSGMTFRSNCLPASLGCHGYEEESVTGTLPRQMSASSSSSSASPVGQAPDVPGNCRMVMQYRKSNDL